MQDATAQQTQSAPQTSPTQQSSYVAPQTAQAVLQWQLPPNGWLLPNPNRLQLQWPKPRWGYKGSNTTLLSISPQPQQAAPQAENPYKDAFNRVVGLLSSPVQFPFQGQQSSSELQQPTKPITDTNKQPHTAVGGQQTYMPSSNSNQAYSNSSSQTSQEITNDQLLANGVSEAKS